MPHASFGLKKRSLERWFGFRTTTIVIAQLDFGGSDYFALISVLFEMI
jgi:hypothetical protein